MNGRRREYEKRRRGWTEKEAKFASRMVEKVMRRSNNTDDTALSKGFVASNRRF